MLSYLAILFPCILSGLWFLVFATRFTKSVEFQHLTFLACLTAVFFFVDACYCMPGLNTRTIIAADILKQFITPSMGLYCWYYFCALKKDTKTHTNTGYLIAIPTFLMAIGAISYLIMGYNDADRFIHAYEAQGSYPDGFDETIFQINKFICHDCYNAIECVIVCSLLIYLVRDLYKTGYTLSESFRAIFKNEPVSIHHIQCINFIHFLFIFGLKLILGRGYLINHPGVSIGLFAYLGVIVLLICVAAIMGTTESITLGKLYLGKVEKFEPAEAPMQKEEPVEETIEETDTTIEDVETEDCEEGDDEDYVEDNMGDDGIDDEMPQTPGYHVSTIKYDESLVDKFKVAVIENKLYLKNGLTIKDVCEELGSNKTYISKMVNERFGMPFPNYINMLRVDYAKQYLLEHPDAKQEEIADECGFPNAAGFNRSFKKETGTTPRIWLAKNLKK